MLLFLFQHPYDAIKTTPQPLPQAPPPPLLGCSLPQTEETPQHILEVGVGAAVFDRCASADSVDLCRLCCHQNWRQSRQVGKKVKRRNQFQQRREKSVVRVI